MAIVNPETLEIVAQVPANPNPHESATDGTYAYVSNSGASSITVIDLESQQQVEGIDMRPLSPTHGLWVAQGKLYFASEQSRAIGCYNPESGEIEWVLGTGQWASDRKSTRLNSSHVASSYAVFCLKKKKRQT